MHRCDMGQLALIAVVLSTRLHAQNTYQLNEFANRSPALGSAQARLGGARSDCKSRMGGDLKTVVAYIQCDDAAWMEFYRTIAFPWMDIVFKNQSDHLAIAEAADAGQISPDRLSLELTALDERFNQEIDRRAEAAARAVQRSQAPARGSDDACRAAATAAFGQPSGGDIGTAFANANRAYLACKGGAPPPPPPQASTTYCTPNGPGLGFTCTTQ